MIIKPAVSVISADRVDSAIDLHLQAMVKGAAPPSLSVEKSVAYTILINAHDHLIGNWFPRAGDNRPYPNSHIWVQDMKYSYAYTERSQFWINDGSFDLSGESPLLLTTLGAYKNLFSGCGIVHDHAPIQADAYYDHFPIKVPRNYRQCHSITLGNWWGGKSAEEEMKLTQGKMPFIIHLGEGTDDIAKSEFSELERRGLLRSNTVMIHGIAFTDKEIDRIAQAGATVCWCPTSNMFLIGKTFAADYAIRAGVNVVIGTDSTMSGSVNLFNELSYAAKIYPGLDTRSLYRMVTENAVMALMLPAHYGHLDPESTHNLLLVDRIDTNPFDNLLCIDASNIILMILDDLPVYGDLVWLEHFAVDGDNYTTFRTGSREKFVLGDPIDLNDQIDATLGYHKDFPYLPF